MRKVHEKSVILGIGIGMIITAIAGMIYSAGIQKEPGKEEIIRLAKGYGLIEQAKIIDSGNTAKSSVTSGNEGSSVANPTSNQKDVEGNGSKNNEDENIKAEAENTRANENVKAADGRNIEIEIKSGYKSQMVVDLLLEKEIISSGEAFMKVLDSYDASTKINIGTFKFKKNDDLDYVVKTICNITR